MLVRQGDIIVTFIRGRRGKSTIACALEEQVVLANSPPRPAGWVFHNDATDQEIIEKAKTHPRIFVCCKKDFPEKCCFPARYITASDLWPEPSTKEQA
jgi:hypothetical protein